MIAQHRRYVSLLLIVFFLAFTQWIAPQAEANEHNANEHCCLLCHVAPIASLDATAALPAAPVLCAIWIQAVSPAEAPAGAPVATKSSRAPPAPAIS